jgi:hypothetical protein
VCTYLSPPRNGVYYFRRGIPEHLRPLVGKTEFLRSMRTKDRAEAKRLLPQYTMASEKELTAAQTAFDSIAQAPADTAHTTAMKAQWQRREQAQWEHKQAGAAHFENEDDARAERQAARAEHKRRLEQRLKLTTADLSPEEAAFKDIMGDKDFDVVIAREQLAAYKATLAQVAETRDISLLDNPFTVQAEAKAKPRVSITGMFDAYGGQDGIRSATVRQFRQIIAHFVGFIGHDDATAVTTQDIIRWRIHLVSEISATGKPRSPSTINGSYLAAVAPCLRRSGPRC